MHTSTTIRLSLYLLMFLGEESLLRPVQEKRVRRKDWNGNSSFYKNGRFRRSIPDMDAVNPAYFDVESQPDQEQPFDPQGDISHFSLRDQVGNLFRSHKLGKHAQKTHARQTQGERAVNLAVEEQSMVNGRLPADEQEECYKQQNIESPSQEEPLRRDWARNQEPHAIPKMDVAQVPLTWPVNEGGQEVHENRDNTFRGGQEVNEHQDKQFGDGQEVNENRDKVFGGRELEKQEVDSLYSGPEQVLKLKKMKPSYQSRPPESLSECSRVYKPLGVKAEFPVYDEDLDFHPDPLQGILDDKYWLDPQEQEAVIRKYIDLAANNMILPGLEYGKRQVDKGHHEVKSVNSKIGFKGVNSQCPCKEISACGDCSKGKKKTNYSENSGDNVVFGRKLLSIDLNTHVLDQPANQKPLSSNSNKVPTLSRENGPVYSLNQISDHYGNEGFISEDNEDSPHFENIDGLRFKSRTLLSLTGSPDILENYVDSEIYDNAPKKHNVIGRNILWYGVYDEDEKSYNDEEDEEEEISHSIVGKVNSGSQVVNREAVDWFEDEHANAVIKTGRLGEVLNEHSGVISHGNLDSNNLTSNDNHLNQGLNEIKMFNKQLLKTAEKPPGYYTSNKLANMLQKPFQEKPKGPKKNKTDPSYEFEVIRNKTLYNATFEATSEKPPRPKVCFKRGSRNNLSTAKNRRSYADIPMDVKNQQVVPLFQSSDGSIGSDVKDGNSESSLSTQSNPSTSQSQAINCTSARNNVTTVSPNKTAQLLSNQSKQSLKSKFDDRDAEETEDVEVANDIVETVISESEKSSVLGHNLGICKRNESVTKMKYGQIVPEAEKVLKSVTDCIMDRIKAHLALQSCILLDAELLEFLKWIVLSGESYKEYMQRLGPKYYDFVPVTTANVTTCGPPTSQMCEQEPLPPNPNVVSSLNSNSANVYR